MATSDYVLDGRSSVARQYLAATSTLSSVAGATGSRSFSHSGSVSERLEAILKPSLSLSQEDMAASAEDDDDDDDNIEFNKQAGRSAAATAPAFSSLSLDANDMELARIRRAKYWLQK